MTALLNGSIISDKLKRWLVPGVFLLVTLIVFGTQTGAVGFWGHNHGWVSSHTLAVMSRATPENLFVGHAITYSHADGSLGDVYYERYPFFVSAFIGNMIRLTPDLGPKIFLARQVMNLIFVLSMYLAFRLVRLLIDNAYLALSAAVLAFSGYYLLFFRDMVHYDQPALLGMILLLYMIGRYKLRGEKRWLIPAVLVAVGLGRGYASFAILGLWFLFEALGLLRAADLDWKARILRVLTHDATRIMVIGLLWGASLLAYDVVVESIQTGEAILNTSVIESARRRLPFGYEGGRNVEDTSGIPPPPWDEFTVLQSDRLLRWFAPVKYELSDETPSPWSLPLAGLGLLAVLVFAWKQPPPRRMLILLTAFSSLLWVFFMINLTAEHDYTAMYLLGLALMIYAALLVPLRRWSRSGPLLLALSLGLFLASNLRFYHENVDFARSYDVYTADYNRILQAAQGEHRSFYNTFENNCVIDNSRCYALGFYLDGHYLSSFDNADYVITPHVYYAEPAFLAPDDTDGLLLMLPSLTPDNVTTQLYDVAAAQRRYLPDDLEPLFNFGDFFSLQKWTLNESVQVQPCQQISLESWWQMESQPDANYSMQLALVNADGESVSAANSDLSILPTQDWVPDTYVLDARTLAIPCDIAPGDYALVMSVYDPATLATVGDLPVSMPDGTPVGQQYVYLTTLFVDN